MFDKQAAADMKHARTYVGQNGDLHDECIADVVDDLDELLYKVGEHVRSRREFMQSEAAEALHVPARKPAC